MRNDFTICDKVADRSWSHDDHCLRALKNLAPGRRAWFDAQIYRLDRPVLRRIILGSRHRTDRNIRSHERFWFSGHAKTTPLAQGGQRF